MKYPLEDLLRVRVFREDAAQIEVRTQRANVAMAEDNLRNKQRDLEEYVKYRERREEELYKEIMDHEVQMRDLDDLKVNVSILREKQLVYEDQVQKARRELTEAEAVLEQAETDYSTATKNRQKIDEHKAIWAQEEAQRCEAEVEKEMEDFRVRKTEAFE